MPDQLELNGLTVGAYSGPLLGPNHLFAQSPSLAQKATPPMIKPGSDNPCGFRPPQLTNELDPLDQCTPKVDRASDVASKPRQKIYA
ncbi:unnamed protein product [Linum trigynum]|uniref:Uncharacterized protein n=1 Tax=Linum trigynum TaxID=586398 RepID=A0AAV2DE16_9ROSI